MTRRWTLIGVLTAGAFGYAVVPNGSSLRPVLYLAVAAAALLTAGLGVSRAQPRNRRHWALFLAGLACRLLGDVTWFVLDLVLHVSPFTSVADAFYLASYPLMGLGLALMVRARQPGHDRAATLDAAIITTGAAVLAAIFVIAPTVTDTTQGALGRIVSTAYPLADLLLLAVLARLWTSSGSAPGAYRVLGLGLMFTLAGDMGYDAVYLAAGEVPAGPWLDLCLLLGYVSVAGAAVMPSMRDLHEPAREADQSLPRPRLLALTVAAVLAPATLLFEGIRDRPLHWQIIGTGSILISTLVLARMSGLFQQVQQQAADLAALARTDGLTGLPNRRTWERELLRACALARSGGTSLTVALLDLDHFKAFNDTAGHTAGDRLLREAATAWRAALPADGFLARYGGEEFGVVLRGRSTAQMHAALEALLRVTPLQQTFSAGIACWDGTEDPEALVSRADTELYAAKRAGRARIMPPPAAQDGCTDLASWASTRAV
ncbi:MAG: hypothetical protein JWN55_1422 [Frankiales bacterium]|nr:hypothetical protein [Frankiales bacterium]